MSEQQKLDSASDPESRLTTRISPFRRHRKVCTQNYGNEASPLGLTSLEGCCASVSSPRRPSVISYSIGCGAIAHVE